MANPDVELAEMPVSVVLEKGVDAAIRALPNRSAWLRRAIAEAARAEGLVKDEKA